MITQDLALGSTAQCLDGPGGHATRLIVDSSNRRLTHLVVERGTGLGAVIVPIERLDHVASTEPVLNMAVDDLAGLPHFVETDYPVPQPEWIERHGYVPDTTRAVPYATSGFAAPVTLSWAVQLVREHEHPGLSPSQVPLGPGTRVALGDHTLGHLDHVLLDPGTAALRALVVRRGHLGHRDVIVPMEWVQAITEEDVLLDPDRALLKHMPDYYPIPSDEAATANLQEAETPPQAVEAENPLLVESALVAKVTAALAHDARTAGAAIDVSCQAGSIILSGSVRTEVERDAALEVAQGVRETAVVLDEMEVGPDAAGRVWPRLDFETLLSASQGLASRR